MISEVISEVIGRRGLHATETPDLWQVRPIFVIVDAPVVIKN
jgi:hypothetical protein